MVLINVQVFCSPTRCIPVNACLHFGRACCLHLQGSQSWVILEHLEHDNYKLHRNLRNFTMYMASYPRQLKSSPSHLILSQNKPYFVRRITEAIILVELGCNDLGLCDISSITLYILWYQLISHKARLFCIP